MSHRLAIAGVTAALKGLISDALAGPDIASIGGCVLSARPPDGSPTGDPHANMLNLFLYRLGDDGARRSATPPAGDARGGRWGATPVALDLHYLISVYGARDMNAEVVIGHARQCLDDSPLIDRDRLRGALGPLAMTGFADRIEQLRITPEPLSIEDLSRIWTMIRAPYRLSIGYRVTALLRDGAPDDAPPEA